MHDYKSLELIISVAERIFFKYGYSNTSVEDIATECGMSKKTIYKSFKSKEEILIECVKRKIDHNSQKISEIIYLEDMKFHDKIEMIILVTGENLKEIDMSFLYDIKKTYNQAWKLIENHKFNHIPQKITYLINEGIKKAILKKM